MRTPRTHAPRAACLALLLALAGCRGCGHGAVPRDLLRDADGLVPPPAEGHLDEGRAPADLVEARVAGRERDWVAKQMGKQIRIDDDVRRTLPASPPSLLRYTVDIPAGAVLAFACGIGSDRQDQPPVSFTVKLKADGQETAVFVQELDPIHKPKHRRWVPAQVDLSKYQGRNRELVFETTSGEKGDDPRRAFWATPVLQVPKDDAPIVVIYLVDTLRADHTTPYGYARDTTPALAAFAKDAVVFDTAVAQASWTKPSVASMMTSLLPGRHRAAQLRDKLDLNLPTLPKMLQAKGWETGAAISNSVIYSAGVNFEQGYDRFTGIHGEGNRASKVVEAGPVVDTALQWIDERRGFPTFVYVHTMDPHVPYTPPPPFDQKYEPHPTPDHPAVDPRTDYKEPLDRDRFIAQYDGEIAYGDQEFGRFVQGLKQRGLYDRALVVFMGDHGEEFMDHGKWLHGRSVFDELIHIPMIVKFPGNASAGTRVKQQVQEVDVLPTVLQAAGLGIPQSPAIVGHPLQPVVKGGQPEPEAIAEISHRGFVAHGIRTSADKYVRRFSPEEDELYFDLVKDPKEQSSILDQSGERVRRLKADVEAAMVPDPFRRNVRVSGSGEWLLRLRTGGWFEGVESSGLGTSEKVEVENGTRRLALRLRPVPGKPREVAFNIRPMGAPVTIEGTHDGKPITPADVRIGQEGYHPDAVPIELPDIEPRGEDDTPRTENIFAAPPPQPTGIGLWLTVSPGRDLMNLDKAAREQLCALGYIPCPH